MTKAQLKRWEEHEEAYKKLLTVEWKTQKCGQPKCWCLMIVPKEKIEYSGCEEAYVAGSGCIDKDTAKYLVKLHNESLHNALK